MGNSGSHDVASVDPDDCFDGIETLGYRVLGVQPNSPASAAGLVSFFDFLLGANGELLLGSGQDLQEGDEYDDVDFPALLESFKGRTLQLLVHNIKSQQQRLVDIVPNDDWDGAGLLGVTIRLDNYAGAEDRLIRILSVEPQSPAAIAGLVESQDYLLGTTTHSFDSTQVLAMVLEAHVDRVVELYVYNTNSDKVRVVALMPTLSWGGKGLLGAEVGTGYLHRLPGSCRSTLGGSVERRVRWIGGKAPPSTPQSHQRQQQQQPDASQQPSQQPTLELEPQLEMEPHENDDHDPATAHEQRHKAPSEVAYDRETSMGTVSLEEYSQPNSPQETQAQARVETVVETVPAPEANADEQMAAAEPQNTPYQSTPTDQQEPVQELNAQKSQEPRVEPPPASAPAPFALFRNPFAAAAQPLPPPQPEASASLVHENGGGTPYNQQQQPQTVGASSPASMPTTLASSTPTHDLKPVSAKDLFAGPPPGANAVPATPEQPITGTAPAFATPHPPPGSNPPPVAFGAIGLPPPPTMSGARH